MLISSFLNTVSPRITVSTKELRSCLDKYSKKNPSRPTACMQEVRRIYDDVLSDTLTNDQLHALAKALNAAKRHSDKDTLDACDALYTKMAPVLPYAHNSAKAFYKFVCRPYLDNYIKKIQKAIDNFGFCPYSPIDLLAEHSEALRVISESRNFTPTVLNDAVCNAAKSVGYEYLIPLAEAIDWMREEEEKIYQNKNNNKNPELLSDANLDLLLKNPKQATLIAEVLINLHQRGMAKPHRHRAEKYIEEMLRDKPEKFNLFANAFIQMPATITEKLNHALSKEQLDEIVDDCIHDNALAQLPNALTQVARAAL